MEFGEYTFYHGSYAVLNSPEEIDPKRFTPQRYGGRGLYVHPTLDEVLYYGGKAFHEVKVKGNLLDLTTEKDLGLFNRIREENPNLDTIINPDGELYDLLAKDHSVDLIRLNERTYVIKNIEKIIEIKPVKVN